MDLRTLLAVTTTLAFWSSAFAAIRVGLTGYGPGELGLLRFLTASAAFGVYALLTRMPLPRRQDLPAILALGFAGITVYHLALNFGEVTVLAGTASLIVATAPAFTAAISSFALGERLTPQGWIGIATSFAGVVLITLGSGAGFGLSPGALLILVAALATSVFFVYQKLLYRHYGAIRLTAYFTWAGTLPMLLFLPGLIARLPAAPLEASLAALYTGVFPAAVAYVAWGWALSRAPAGLVSSFLYLNPVLATFIAWLWLGEIPSFLSFAGGALALLGVLVVNTAGRRERTRSSTARASADPSPVESGERRA